MTADDQEKPYSAFDQGPPTEPQLKQLQHGMGRMIREFTGNPVGFVEYGGQMLPYPSIFTGHRKRPVEHATLREMQALDQHGVTVLPPEEQGGTLPSYRVGSGAQFVQANVSLLGSIQQAYDDSIGLGEELAEARGYAPAAAQGPFRGWATPAVGAPSAAPAQDLTPKAPTTQAEMRAVGPPPTTAGAVKKEKAQQKAKKKFGWGVKKR